MKWFESEKWTGISFADLLGQTLVKIEGLHAASELVEFVTASGKRYSMYHLQDCCEGVYVEDVVGDVQDLIGSPITLAEEVQGSNEPEGWVPDEYEDSYTWTYYRMATAKGHVDIRWYGSSNGYYSEEVSFSILKDKYDTTTEGQGRKEGS